MYEYGLCVTFLLLSGFLEFLYWQKCRNECDWWGGGLSKVTPISISLWRNEKARALNQIFFHSSPTFSFPTFFFYSFLCNIEVCFFRFDIHVSLLFFCRVVFFLTSFFFLYFVPLRLCVRCSIGYMTSCIMHKCCIQFPYLPELNANRISVS